jgi:hypothetical protein
MINTAQIRILNVARKQLHLEDEETWRALLKRHGSKSGSCKDLDDRTFDHLMITFASLGFVNRSRHRPIGHSTSRSMRGMASEAQISKIRRLWDESTDGQGTDLTLGRFLHNKFGVSAVRVVAFEAAQDRIIGALTVMCQRKRERERERERETPPASREG